MEEENNSFLDKNTLLAIGLSVLFFMGWQSFLEKKYPSQDKVKAVAKAGNQAAASSDSIVSDKKAVDKTVENQESPQDIAPAATEISQDFENFNISLSSSGMGLTQVALNKYSDRQDKKILFSSPDTQWGNFATLYQGRPVQFDLQQKASNHFVGTGRVGSQTLIKEMIFNDSTYTVDVRMKTVSGDPSKAGEIEVFLSNNVLKVESSSFLAPQMDGTEFFSIDDGDEERERLDVDDKFDQQYSKVSLTSIATLYFAIAMNDQSPYVPKSRLVYSPEKKVAYAHVIYPEATNGASTDIQFTGFIGPKKYDILNNLHEDFVKMINYGIFGALSKPMLKILKWLHDLSGNWGVGIIILTIFIRLLLLPINISSIRSMRKMQKIQPQMKALKEKYKDDPQRMNQETMALMKKEGANPIGGCLPMFLQLPVFLALYSVIGQSVELYKSPFIYWIQDLSYKDPYFVLPVLVGILYFVQMSITPQPTDPTQAKVMKIIPLIFCFFMITFPSGLTLYFFVNTIFGIGQQYFFQKEKRKEAAA